MVFAPRTIVRLLLVLRIDWTALAMSILVEVHGAYNDVIRLCLQIFTLVWYFVFPWARASGAFGGSLFESCIHSLPSAFYEA